MEGNTKVWITRYALTNGIYEIDVEPPSAGSAGMIVDRSNGYEQPFHGEGKDWHRTKMSAVSQARAMRKKKIASLEKTIARLERLTF